MNETQINQTNYAEFCKSLANHNDGYDLNKFNDIHKVIDNAFNLLDKTPYTEKARNLKILRVNLENRFYRISCDKPTTPQPKGFLEELKNKIDEKRQASEQDIINYIIDSIDVKEQEAHGIKAVNVSKYLQLKKVGNSIQIVCPDNDKLHISLPCINQTAGAQSDLYKINVEQTSSPSHYNVKISAVVKKPDGSLDHYKPLEELDVAVLNNDTSFCLIHNKAKPSNLDRINFDGYIRLLQNRLMYTYHIKKDKQKPQKTIKEIETGR